MVGHMPSVGVHAGHTFSEMILPNRVRKNSSRFCHNAVLNSVDLHWKLGP